MTEDEILLNRIAQDKVPLEEGILWYDSLEATQQKLALYKLAYLLEQAHPSLESIQAGIELAPIKPTMTPVVIFQKNNLGVAVTKVLQLPENEWRKAFITMLGIFKAGDTKRRQTCCKDGCSHEWHHLKD